MITSQKKKAAILGFFFLLATTLIYRSDICCMFNASRYYGWPSSYIVVNKTTEFLEEAKKIETENVVNLVKDGWTVSFNANAMGQFGVSSVAALNLITNYLFYYAISYLLIKTNILYKKRLSSPPAV